MPSMSMTSQDRILAAFRGEQPDRVPVVTFGINPLNEDHWATHDPSFRRVCELALAQSDLFYRFGFDTGFWGSDPDAVGYRREDWQEGDARFVRQWFETASGPLTSLTRYDDGVVTAWKLEPFVKTVKDAKALLTLGYAPPVIDLRSYRAATAKLGDRGVMHATFIDPIMAVLSFTTFEFGAILAVTEPELFTDLLIMFHERLYSAYQRVLDEVDPPLVIRYGGCEYATPPLMDPRYFYRYVVPYEKQICDLIRAYEGCYCQLHCHGNMRDVMDGIVEMNPHAVEPIEPPPQGDIPLAEFKARWGDRFCMVGNIEFDAMQQCTPQEMDELCRQAIADAAAGGGFILTQTAPPITSLTPRMQDNYVAFIEAGRRYGAYDGAGTHAGSELRG